MFLFYNSRSMSGPLMSGQMEIHLRSSAANANIVFFSRADQNGGGDRHENFAEAPILPVVGVREVWHRLVTELR